MILIPNELYKEDNKQSYLIELAEIIGETIEALRLNTDTCSYEVKYTYNQRFEKIDSSIDYIQTYVIKRFNYYLKLNLVYNSYWKNTYTYFDTYTRERVIDYSKPKYYSLSCPHLYLQESKESIISKRILDSKNLHNKLKMFDI